MGVQGLTSILQSKARARQHVCLDGRNPPQANILLVDASAVMFHVVEKLGLKWTSPNHNEAVYKEACRFYGGLKQVGLRPILVLDTACTPGHEVEHTTRRVESHAAGNLFSPTTSMVMSHVYKDLELEVEHSIHSADKLLLALYHKHRSSVFAMLTKDSDFMVYGVHKIVLVGNAVVDHGTVTFQMLSTLEAWKDLQAQAVMRQAVPGGALPPVILPNLLKRAQVAAIMGNDRSKDVRQRLAARNGQMRTTGSGFKCGHVLSMGMATNEVLVRDEDEPLDLKFFRETLRMRGFTEQALQEFQEVVNEYVKDDELARSPDALDKLRMTPASLPWLPAPLVERMKDEPVPGLMLALACRGFAVPFEVPEPCKQLLQEVRRRAASVLRAPGAAVHEFCYITEKLSRLMSEGPESGAASAGPRSADWFSPGTHLPASPVVDASGSANAAEVMQELSPVGRTMQETAAAVQRACEAAGTKDLAPALAAFYAVLLHALEPSTAEVPPGQFRAACRELLLPGVPVYTPEVEEREDESEPLPDGEASKVVDVGSGLSKDDWDEIDDKGVISSVKSSTGYKLMQEIQPYQPAAELSSAPLPRDLLFRLFYVLSQQANSGDTWKKITKACFPTEYASTKEGDPKAAKAKAKELASAPKDALLQELRGDKSPGAAYALTWLGRLTEFIEFGAGMRGVQAGRLLALMKDATLGGPKSPQWAAAQVCMQLAPPAVRQEAKQEMWSGSNSNIATGGKPMRYPQQQELMDMVRDHLEDAKVEEKPQPLHIILSTPTGSGKTFTAVMLHLHLLKQGYEDQILVYSVPTKQVLKRVGQECEAHNVVYWTAAKDGDLHQVRRPYSIRTERGDRKLGSGTMAEQLSATATQGAASHDLGGGHPSVIIADIDSTAALMQAAQEAPPSAFYHASNLLLYFDEPNMGLRLDPRVQRIVREVMANAPFTTVLASATMPPSWEYLPKWWKGRGGAVRTAITQEPYNLPMSRLELVSNTHSMRIQLNMLQLFRSYNEFHHTVNTNQRLRVLLLRHLTPKQANQLLQMQSSVEGDTGPAPETEEDLVTLFGRDVASLRESLEPQLMDLTPEQFAQLRNTEWAEKPAYAPGGLLGVQSPQGVTMIATLNPRDVALEVAGYRNKSNWGDAVRDVRARISEARQAQRQQAKEQQRSRKDDDAPLGGDEGTPMVRLRIGLSVDIEDAQDTDIDTLVMLSRGVAYASSGASQEVEPLVKRLYQQALLRIPEKAGKKPPIDRLVVDYSGIYGTDCPSVDTVMMHESLGRLLSFDDHLQFIGRLRRDGVAIYPSLSMLRSATTGIPSEEKDTELIGEARPEALRDAMLPVLATEPPKSVNDVLAAAKAKKQEADMSDASALCGMWMALSSDTDGLSTDELKKELVRRLKAYTKVLTEFATSGKAEVALIKQLQRQCFQTDKRMEGLLSLMLRVLYELEVVSDEAIMHWHKKASDPVGREAALKQTEALVKWLEEESEEEEEEGE